MPVEAMAGKMLTVDELADLTENAEENYRRTVITAARTGNTPSPRDLLIAVSVMGRNSGQFLQDVERVKRRIAAVEDIADTDTRKPEVDALHEEWMKQSAAYNEVERECKARLEAARTARDKAWSNHHRASEELKHQRSKAFELLLTTADPAIDREVVAAEHQMHELRDMLPGMNHGHSFEGNHLVRLKRAEAKGGDAYTQELGAVKEEVIAKADAIEKSIPAIRQKKYDPERFKIV
jgi:hypothetical protein